METVETPDTNLIAITRTHRVILEPTCGAFSCEKEESLTPVGYCPDQCCTDYRCPDCGKKFRVEWPD